MDELVIPAWALYLLTGLGTLLITWLVWLTLRTNDNERSAALNALNFQHVTERLTNIYNLIAQLNLKLDTFLSKEMDFLKDHASKK